MSTGRYSKSLTPESQDTYHRLLGSDGLLELDDEIAILQASLAQKLKEVEVGGTEDNWTALSNSWYEFMDAVANQDSDTQTELVFKIDSIVRKARQESKSFSEIQRLIESLRKLTESESKRRIQNKTLIGMERVMLIVNAALNALKEAAYANTEPMIARKIIEDAERRHARLISPGPSANREIAGSVVE